MTISFARHQFPPTIIRHAVWLYMRFTLSYRDVEDLLAERGLDVSYETVRRWVLKFGPLFARELRRRRPRPTSRWHLDEMAMTIADRQFWLWRAVDDEGEVLAPGDQIPGRGVRPTRYGVELTDRPAIAGAVFDVQKQYGISDRKLLDEARVSHHTLEGLKEGKRIADASLMKLFRAPEALRQEADPVAAAMDKALHDLRRLKEKAGGRNKLADLLGASRPYIGRVLKGEKPMTEELAKMVREARLEDSYSGKRSAEMLP
jgi:hypothetical protein